ncbi:unnamed protein product [Closterium sp. NIES-65]|nr:unnamed protein product [Closterium sp. NIES-65]
MAGSQEWKEAMEMMRALHLQVEGMRRELAAAKKDSEEAERRRVAEMREMRGQVEEREREVTAELEAVKGELAGVKGELAREREERRREVQEVERRRAADLTEMRGQLEEREREKKAGKGWLVAVQKDAGMKMDVEGVQKRVWEASVQRG